MNTKVESIRAYDKNCIGCQRYGGDVMISYTSKDDERFNIIDIFLTQDQAIALVEELQQKIAYNQKAEKEVVE